MRKESRGGDIGSRSLLSVASHQTPRPPWAPDSDRHLNQANCNHPRHHRLSISPANPTAVVPSFFSPALLRHLPPLDCSRYEHATGLRPNTQTQHRVYVPRQKLRYLPSKSLALTFSNSYLTSLSRLQNLSLSSPLKVNKIYLSTRILTYK